MNRATYWACLAILVAWVLFAIFVLHKEKGYISEVIIALICTPRMHDIGKSGWIVAGVFLTYVILALLIVFNLDRDTAMIVLGVVNIGLTGLLIYLGTIAGEPTINAYGSPRPAGIQFGRARSAESRES